VKYRRTARKSLSCQEPIFITGERHDIRGPRGRDAVEMNSYHENVLPFNQTTSHNAMAAPIWRAFGAQLTRTINNYGSSFRPLPRRKISFTGDEAREGPGRACLSRQVAGPTSLAADPKTNCQPQRCGPPSKLVTKSCPKWFEENPRSRKIVVARSSKPSRPRAARKSPRLDRPQDRHGCEFPCRKARIALKRAASKPKSPGGGLNSAWFCASWPVKPPDPGNFLPIEG